MRRALSILPILALLSCSFESDMVITGYEGQPLFAGSAVQLTCNLPDAQWYSSDPSIVEIDGSGSLKVAEGANDDQTRFRVVYITALAGGPGHEIPVTIPPRILISRNHKFLYSLAPYTTKVGYASFGADGTGSIWFKDASPLEAPEPFSFSYRFVGDKMFTSQTDRKMGVSSLPEGGTFECLTLKRGRIVVFWSNDTSGLRLFDYFENDIY